MINTIVASNMADHGARFRRLCVQIITLVAAALYAATITRAQNRGIASASTRSERASGAAFVTGNLPTVAFTNANLGNSWQSSTVFVPSGLALSGQANDTPFASMPNVSAGVSSANSNIFVFAGPPTPFTIVALPNETATVGIDFFPPLSDMLRIGLIADPRNRMAPTN